MLRKRHSLRDDRVTPTARRFHSRPIDYRLPLHAGCCRSCPATRRAAQDALPSPTAGETIRKRFHKADLARRSPADGFTLWRSRNSRWDNRPLPTLCGPTPIAYIRCQNFLHRSEGEADAKGSSRPKNGHRKNSALPRPPRRQQHRCKPSPIAASSSACTQPHVLVAFG
jgi:hypothetical protein